MIRREYETTGYPVTRRTPIICIVKNNPEPLLAYNRYDLYQIAQKYTVEHCIGVWVGKKTTDCFILDIKSYSEHCPPEKHKDIDSAETLSVTKDMAGNYLSIEYTPGSFAEDRTPIVSREPELLAYVKKAGLRHTTTIE